MYKIILPAISILLLGCATQENACEDVTLASEQVQECHSLQKQITNAKDRPIIRTELERRYQQDCVDVRFYRDEQQVAICGNKKEIDAVRKDYKKDEK